MMPPHEEDLEKARERLDAARKKYKEDRSGENLVELMNAENAVDRLEGRSRNIANQFRELVPKDTD